MEKLTKAIIVLWFLMSLGINIPSVNAAPIFWALFMFLGLASVLLSILFLPEEDEE